MSYSISPDGNRIGIVATDPEPASRARDRRDKRDVIWVEHTETVHRLYLVNTKTWRSREVPTLTDMDSLAWSEQSGKFLVLADIRLRDLGPSAVGWQLGPGWKRHPGSASAGLIMPATGGVAEAVKGGDGVRMFPQILLGAKAVLFNGPS